MKVYNIYSKRQKKLRGEFPDVYQYQDVPSQLRVQIFHIISDAMGNHGNQETLRMYKFIHDTLYG
jgi:hypothetical protein